LALIGPAGSGKTTAAEQIAEALNLPFYIQGAVSGAHELVGFVDAHGRYQSTPFRQAFEHGGIIVLDEIDAGDPAGLLVMNAALANGHMAFPDQTAPVKKHENFRVVACANTFGTGADRLYVGRNQLDAATLDRFAALSWDYDETLEATLCADESWRKRVQALRHTASNEKARVIISPRASIYGAKLIAAGLDRATVENILVWKGADSELRRRIETATR
jgi:cobaltochelatase CobS